MDEVNFITDKTLLELLDKEVGTSEKVEETENFIHVPAPGQAGKHKGHKIRYMDISSEKGIRAKYCIPCKKIISYVFTKAKGWTVATAVAWVKDHHKKKSEEKISPMTPGVFGLGGGGVIAAPGEGPGPGVGGADYCACTSCGYYEKHEKGKPCLEKKCPKCGKPLQGEFVGGMKMRGYLLEGLLLEIPQEDNKIRQWLSDKKTETDKAILYDYSPRADTWTTQDSDHLLARTKFDEDLSIDLGYGSKAPAGYLGIDMRSGYGDITYDLEKGIPIPSNRAVVIRAWHVLEYIKDQQSIMEEIWSVLRDGGRLVFEVPSTKGSGAFARPDYKSLWNELSFRFYVEDDLRASIETRAKFQIIELEERTDEERDLVYVRGILEAVKAQEGVAEGPSKVYRRAKSVSLWGDVPPPESKAFEDWLGEELEEVRLLSDSAEFFSQLKEDFDFDGDVHAGEKFWEENWHKMYPVSGKGGFSYRHHVVNLTKAESGLTEEELLKVSHSVHGDLLCTAREGYLWGFGVYTGQASDMEKAEGCRLCGLGPDDKLQGSFKLARPQRWLTMARGSSYVATPGDPETSETSFAKFFEIDHGAYEIGVWRKDFFEIFFHGEKLDGRYVVANVPIGGIKKWFIGKPTDQIPCAISRGRGETIAELARKGQRWLIWAKPGEEPVKIDVAVEAQKAISAKIKSPGFSIFKTIKGKDGRDYWVTVSGSAFLDREKEIISRAALDYSILYHDATGIRGPLRIYHFEDSDVGECLVSLRVRNFLIEAGYWYDSELAEAAKEWVEREDSDPATSVGFFFDPKEFLGTVYQKVIIFERSLIRAIDSACPWTWLRSVSKEVTVGTKEQLAEIIGDEDAEKIVSQAETKSKELEEEGVAFKEVEESEETKEEVAETETEESEESEESAAEKEEVSEVEKDTKIKPSPEKEEAVVEEEEKPEKSKTVEEDEELVLTEESVKALTDAFAEVITPQLKALTTSVEELGARVTELEKPISEKVKEQVELQPKVVVRRATQSKETEADPLVDVPDPSKEIDYSNETPEERDKRLGAFWAEKKQTPEEIDLGE